MSRRQYRSGSVFQRKDGMWIGRFEAGVTREGRRRQITVSATTEARCKEKLEDAKHEHARNGPTETSTRTTVEAWAESWLAMKVRDLAPKGYVTTRSAVRRYIIPTIGRKQLRNLTPADVRAVHEAMRGNVAQSSAKRYHGDLMLMLRDAQAEGHAVPQRVFLVKPPKVGENDRDAIPVDDALAMLAVVADWPDGSQWAAAILQGIRQGERLGLTWECIDFENDTIDISWQLQPLPYVDRKNKHLGFRVPDAYTARHLVDAFHLVRPKSKKSRRVIPMVPWMRNALLAWRDAAPANEYGLVWPTAEGMPQRDPDDRATWQKIQKLANVEHPAGRPYQQHEARHTTATLLLNLGVDRTIVEAILGHSKLVETYDHSDNLARKRAALEQVAEQLALV